MIPSQDNSPPHAAINAKLAAVVKSSSNAPPWYDAWLQLCPQTSPEDRLKVYQAVRDAGSIPEEAGFRLVAWQIDAIACERAETELREMEDRLHELEAEYESEDVVESPPDESRRPQGMRKSSWEQAKALAPQAVAEMSKYIKRRSKGRETTLRDLRREIRNLQNEHKNIPWGAVRIVHSRELLIVEEALECVVTLYACARWAYQVASDHAEHYDSRYPGGLTPASAPCVEDIAEFWCQEHLGKSLDETFQDE